jgi:hypothetical protein
MDRVLNLQRVFMRQLTYYKGLLKVGFYPVTRVNGIINFVVKSS